MSIFDVRKATMDDARYIGDIIRLVWPDSEVNIQRIENVLTYPSHSAMIARIEGDPAGFVDGFMTMSIDGVHRWELDLLAVHPKFQRRGIASALVEANTQEGHRRGAEIARGLVAIDNAGSQKAFARSGYTVDATICELVVCTSRSHKASIEYEQDQAHIFPVSTINYTGLWVEGKRNLKNLKKGIQALVEADHNLVGTIIPEYEETLILDAFRIGYERVGRFQWWSRPLTHF